MPTLIWFGVAGALLTIMAVLLSRGKKSLPVEQESAPPIVEEEPETHPIYRVHTFQLPETTVVEEWKKMPEHLEGRVKNVFYKRRKEWFIYYSASIKSPKYLSFKKAEIWHELDNASEAMAAIEAFTTAWVGSRGPGVTIREDVLREELVYYYKDQKAVRITFKVQSSNKKKKKR